MNRNTIRMIMLIFAATLSEGTLILK